MERYSAVQAARQLVVERAREPLFGKRVGMKSEGWAVIDNGSINIRTVSPTPRAAIVNWLVVERQLLITVFTTDEAIEQMWEANKGAAVVFKVTITADV